MGDEYKKARQMSIRRGTSQGLLIGFPPPSALVQKLNTESTSGPQRNRQVLTETHEQHRLGSDLCHVSVQTLAPTNRVRTWRTRTARVLPVDLRSPPSHVRTPPEAGPEVA